MTTTQESLSKVNDPKQLPQTAQQRDELLLKDLEMDITKLDFAPDFEEQLDSFPFLKKVWEQIKQRIEDANEEGE